MSALSVRADGSGNSTSSGSGISGAATAAGNSMFSFTFDLLEPTAFTLQGTVTYSATFAGHAVTTVGLSDMTGPPTSIFFVQQNSASGTPPPNNIPFST